MDKPKSAPVVDLTEIDEETDGERELQKMEYELREIQRKFDEARANNNATTRENNRNRGEITRMKNTGKTLWVWLLMLIIRVFS